MELPHHSEMRDPWANVSAVSWRKAARPNSQEQSVLAHRSLPRLPEGLLSVVVRVRFDVLCLSPILFAKGKCYRLYSFLG